MTFAPEPVLAERKQQVAQTFNTLANHYDVIQFVRRTADRLVELAQLRPGERVLDLATGTGWVALAAAAEVGSQGHVLGIDIAQEPLAHARGKARDASLGNLVFRTGDAEGLDLPDQSFEAVLCASGIFFLPDPRAALAEWRRVTSPGGRAVFSSFGIGLIGQLGVLFDAHLARAGLPTSPRPPFQDADACRALLDEAGYAEVQISEEDLGYALPHADAWWQELWAGLTRQPLTRLSPEQLSAFRASYLCDVADLATAAGIRVDVPAIFASGTVPTSA